MKIKEEPQKVEQIFILDGETKFLFPFKDGNEIVLSEAELQKFIYHKDDLKAIIILAELEWEGRYSQHFNGFDIAVELRRKHNLLCPIIIISTLSLSYFSDLAQNKKDIKYKLLFGRGTGFLPISELNTTLEKNIESLCRFPLTNAVLTDMNDMLLNQKGLIIDKLTHDLKFGIESNKLSEVLADVSNYLNADQKIELEWETFIKILNDNIRDISKFNKAADELIMNCERLLVNDSKTAGNIFESKHKILVLEDDPDFQKVIEENLKRHFEELLITGSSEQAIEWLQDDGRNEIMGIISDWRLYAEPNEKTYWQLQGYEVLDYAAKNRLIALFALTSLSDRNVHNIRNTLGLDIHLFKKQHLETADSKVQWEMMADTVKQKCDGVRDIIDSTPTGARWILNYYDTYPTKGNKVRINMPSLKQKYAQQRNSQWHVFNADVITTSNNIWVYYNTVVNDNIENCTIKSVKEKYGIELTADDQDLKSLLTARRLFFALWFNCGNIQQTFDRKKWINIADVKFEQFKDENPLIKIYCVFNGKSWKNFAEDYEPTNGERSKNPTFINEEHAALRIIDEAKKLANALCIKPGDLPGKGILPEEKSWLKSIGIDYDKGNSVIDYAADSIDEEDKSSSEPENTRGEQEPTIDEIHRVETELPLFNLRDDEDE